MMTKEETQKIILKYFRDFKPKSGCELRFNKNKYRIKPDDAFYLSDKILLFEYENNKRPVESISKYFWLLNELDWLNENIKIKLLITINNEKLGNDKIRTQSILILGKLLKQIKSDYFDFHFLNFGELSEEALLAELEDMTAAN